MLLTAVLMLAGCMRTVDQMYSIPKRSEDFKELQSAIDSAMDGMNYSAPLSGENQQAYQHRQHRVFRKMGALADQQMDDSQNSCLFCRGQRLKISVKQPDKPADNLAAGVAGLVSGLGRKQKDHNHPQHDRYPRHFFIVFQALPPFPKMF